MNYCASVRKKGSTDQCTAAPILGHVLCGRHIRCKHVTLWVSTQQEKSKILSRCQAVIRGWLVRKRLKLAGPGVLCRKDLVNDDDLVTCESKDKQHPFDYFGLEESGKLWWFDWETIWNWTMRCVSPVNPYTKVPLTMETRRRLREGFAYRIRNNIPIKTQHLRTIQYKWNILIQIFEENGFGLIRQDTFLGMRKVHFITLFNLLQDDVEVIFKDTNTFKRDIIRSCSKIRSLVFKLNTDEYVSECLSILLAFLLMSKDCYVLSFSILSALYRC